MLGVGAVTRRVTFYAAALPGTTIMASRRQVDDTGGYLNWNQEQLVRYVKALNPNCLVFRDHGGPLQGDDLDDGVASLESDVNAGFDGLHLDVSMLPYDEQERALMRLGQRFKNSDVLLEVGEERASQERNFELIDVFTDAVGRWPDLAVIETGGHARNLVNVGKPVDFTDALQAYRAREIAAVAHNADWSDRSLLNNINVINVAPEFALIETEERLKLLSFDAKCDLLEEAWESNKWVKWFDEGYGSWDDHARAAAHYVFEKSHILREWRKINPRIRAQVGTTLIKTLLQEKARRAL